MTTGDQINIDPAAFTDVALELDRVSAATYESSRTQFFGDWPIRDELQAAHVALRQRFQSDHRALQRLSADARTVAQDFVAVENNVGANWQHLAQMTQGSQTTVEQGPSSQPPLTEAPPRIPPTHLPD